MQLLWPLLTVVIVFGVYAGVLALLRRRSGEVYVLGQHLAAAAAVEQRRSQRSDIPKSPMPSEKYDLWHGEQSLIDPVENSLDLALFDLCRAFAESDGEKRSTIRESISMDEFYTLLAFSKRAAVFAIREQNVDWVVKGLTAVAVIEQERTDFRDILWSIAVLYHAARRCGADPELLLRKAAAISEQHVSQLIVGFIDRSPADKDLQTSWGYDEVLTNNGIGLIGRGIDRYVPTFDLARVALDIADYIETDKYQPSVEIATNLPEVWLASDDNRALERILKAANGVVSIHAQLRPGEHPTYESQMLLVFVVEAADNESATLLLEMSVTKKPSDYCMVSVSEGRLFSLIVARSFVAGIESFETTNSLSRFPPAISQILRRYAGSM